MRRVLWRTKPIHWFARSNSSGGLIEAFPSQLDGPLNFQYPNLLQDAKFSIVELSKHVEREFYNIFSTVVSLCQYVAGRVPQLESQV